jgi:hypothetical protein
VALLTFPPNPFPGEVYPINPPVGTQIYQWSNPDQTWVLLGLSTGVVAGTYGDELTVPQITVDTTGRITVAQNVPIRIADTGGLGVVQIGDNIQVSGGLIEVLDGTLTQKGVVQLVDSVSSVSTTTAATPNSVRTAYNLANAAVPRSAYSAKGVILGGTGAGTFASISLGTQGQYLRVDTTAGAGLVWSNPPAIRTLDDLSGSFNGTAITFTLKVGGSTYTPTPSSNLMIFLGGVPQTPGAGNSYTVSGSTITFATAPATGTTFYGVTVY